jgi:hypothetical protein
MTSSVLVPLYVYPSLGAWQPVYDMYVSKYHHVSSIVGSDYYRAASYPQMQFTAIINIHDGPGDGALPNSEYSHAIETLSSFNNVRTVGYGDHVVFERLDLSA